MMKVFCWTAGAEMAGMAATENTVNREAWVPMESMRQSTGMLRYMHKTLGL